MAHFLEKLYKYVSCGSYWQYWTYFFEKWVIFVTQLSAIFSSSNWCVQPNLSPSQCILYSTDSKSSWMILNNVFVVWNNLLAQFLKILRILQRKRWKVFVVVRSCKTWEVRRKNIRYVIRFDISSIGGFIQTCRISPPFGDWSNLEDFSNFWRWIISETRWQCRSSHSHP